MASLIHIVALVLTETTQLRLREVFSYGRYLRQKFGVRVSKVPIALPGFTCPNIDGVLARGGCTYCDNESFSPNLALAPKIKSKVNFSTNLMLDKQLEALSYQYAKTSTKLAKKYKSKAFLVYFQAFSNTYAPLDSLKKLYETALTLPNVVGISIGTRSDCVNDEILDYLSELSTKCELWLEFGVQSIFNETLEKINRAHTYENTKEAIIKAKKRGIKVCAHLIFGLPDETKEMMLASVQEIINLEVDSVKFHPLYVVSNTALANSYNKNEWKPLLEEDYINILTDAILMLPNTISIQRFSAGDSTLLAPDWCSDKHNQMKNIKDALLSIGLKL